MNIRLPCSRYITVKVDKNDTILLLKENICLTNILFVKEHFHLYLPGQEQPLHDELSLLSLPDVPFLQMIPDTLDISKITYDAYSCERHNVTPSPSFYSTIEDLVNTFSNTNTNTTTNKTIRVYTSSNIQQSTTSIDDSPTKPNVPSVPKAIMGAKSFKYADYNNSCIIS
jgi:hypothetical protein